MTRLNTAKEAILHSFILCTLPLMALTMGACDGSGSGSGSDINVTDVSTDSRVIALGAQTVANVDVSYDSGRISSGEHLYIVLRLPAQLVYLDGSAEIDGFTSADDNTIDPTISNCATGEQFLAFNVSESDLLRANNPSGDADMRLKLTLVGAAQGNDVLIQTRAEPQLPSYSCGAPFLSQADSTISVQ